MVNGKYKGSISGQLGINLFQFFILPLSESSIKLVFILFG